jgi:uncharacterized membrane protein
VACLIYVAWVWPVIRRMDAAATSAHASREDPTKRTSDVLLLIAGAASLVAIGYILVQAKGSPPGAKGLLAGLAVTSVALSWLLVHTLFTLRYAMLYYSGHAGGVDFNQTEDPTYLEFAYLSFTIGMTFQVSDTDLTARGIRATALQHALLSFLFGSVVLATTVNLVASLG